MMLRGAVVNRNIGPRVVRKNREICAGRFLCVPYVLFIMVPRIGVVSDGGYDPSHSFSARNLKVGTPAVIPPGTRPSSEMGATSLQPF